MLWTSARKILDKALSYIEVVEMDIRLKEKIVFSVGGISGFGLSAATLTARKGVKLIIISRNVVNMTNT